MQIRDGGSASILRTQGDWDDLDASVQVGAEQSEAAIVRSSGKAGEPERAFELRSALNEPISLRAKRVPDGVELECRWGRLGDAGREAGLLARVARRLSDLRGVEFAPIRE